MITVARKLGYWEGQLVPVISKGMLGCVCECVRWQCMLRWW